MLLSLLLWPSLSCQALMLVLGCLVACMATSPRAAWVDDDDGLSPPPWAKMTRYFTWQSQPPATLLQAALTKQAETMLSAREALIGGIDTVEEWQARQVRRLGPSGTCTLVASSVTL